MTRKSGVEVLWKKLRLWTSFIGVNEEVSKISTKFSKKIDSEEKEGRVKVPGPKIAIENRHREIKIERKKMNKIAGAILASMGCTSVELSILFMNDEGMRELNRGYRKMDKPTDVLSFPMREGEFSGLNPGLLGDVAISLDTAKKQAKENGKTLEEEVTFLLIHGILHLLGFDHEASPAEARLMRAKEKEILKLVNGHLKPVSPSRV